MRISDAARILGNQGITVDASGEGFFERFSTLNEADSESAVFFHDRGSPEQLAERVADLQNKKPALVITTEKLFPFLPPNIENVLIVEDPRLAFSILAGFVHFNRRPDQIGAGVVIHPWVSIGKRVHVGQCSEVGSDGLSANRHGNILHHTAHIGMVVIEDDVWIGPFCAVQRAVLGKTIIGLGSNLDSHVVVAHGSRLGKRVAIGAHTTVCGSCTIGDDVWIGCNSVIREGLTIGDGAFVGIGSVVVKNVAPGEMVVGNPARKLEGGRRPW
jgi:UDP-3-O-[3-hydroxymyristoyl] glucosamine N-acyltransferase